MNVVEAEQEKDVLLQIRDLKVWYSIRGTKDPLKAVDGVSFDLTAGKTTGLVGESGSGKSTIGRAIVKLAPIEQGRIIYKGREIQDLSNKGFSEMRKRIQMIFQDPYHTLNPRMTVGRLLDEPLKIHFPNMNQMERSIRCVDLVNQVGLSKTCLDRYPHQFSGGQRQRIGIARAMTVEPEVLICDEAVSALDVSVQAQIVNLLQDLQEQHGFACLFIGHDLAVIEHISDDVLVMRNGKIVEYGTPESIYQHPREAYTKQLLDAVPKLKSISG